MVIGRLLGRLLVLCALVVLGRDLIAWYMEGRFAPIAIGQLWFDIHPGSLEMLRPAIQQHLHPALWNWVVQPVLRWYAFPTLLVLGLLLMLLCRRRGKVRIRRR